MDGDWFVDDNPDPRLVDNESDSDTPELPKAPKPSPGGISCEYCRCRESLSLVKCGETGKYFCNGCTEGRNYSHIVIHLVKAKTTTVQLPNSNTIASCQACKCTNVFKLYQVPVRGGSPVFLCSSCLTDCRSGKRNAATRSLNVQLDRSVKVVDNNMFADELVETPEEMPIHATKPLIDSLEREWSDDGGRNPAAAVESILEKMKFLAMDWEPAKDTYSSAEEYVSVMKRLIYSEMEQEEAACNDPEKCMKVTDINWYQPPKQNAYVIATFKATDFDFARKVRVGNSLQLDSTYCYKGVVTEVKTNVFPGVIKMKIETGGYEIPLDDPNIKNMTVRFVFDANQYDKQLEALNIFAKKCHGENRKEANLVKDIWMGIARDYGEVKQYVGEERVRPLRKLDKDQLNAINSCLSKTVTVVEGPPGTGKTAVISAFVFHALRNNPTAKILVCGPTNSVVCNLQEHIHFTGIDVVRLMSKEYDDPDVKEQMFDKSTVNRMLFDPTSNDQRIKRLIELRKIKTRRGYWKDEEEQEYRNLRRDVEKRICESKKVVCCTAAMSGSGALKNCKFDYVIVDEVTQMVEPDALIPIMNNINHLTKVILVGDYKQIGPTVPLSLRGTGYELSKIERFVHLGMPTCKLNTQYRMHPSLIKFSSDYFYQGKIVNGVTAHDRPSRFPFPNPEHPMMFVETPGMECRSSITKSWINEAEAAAVCDIVCQIYKIYNAQIQAEIKAAIAARDRYVDVTGKNQYQTAARSIGIITPYGGQCELIARMLREYGPALPESFVEHIVVDTLDSFQGSQKAYIIFSCVRTNRVTGIGFLKDVRRLNVALTRAQAGLFLFGSIGALKRCKGWKELLEEYCSLGLIYTGDVMHTESLHQISVDEFHGREADAVDDDE